MSVDAIRELVTRLSQSTGALAALAVALDHRLGAAVDADVEAELRGVVDALGVRDTLNGMTPEEIRPMLAGIRTTLLQGTKLAVGATSGAGWSHTESAILQNAGELSAALPAAVKRIIAPRLEGLSARLESADGKALDVGVGVAALSIAMARLWPSLRIVGIDVWKPALAIARENVKKAGLENRIELREQAVQDLADNDEYDIPATTL